MIIGTTLPTNTPVTAYLVRIQDSSTSSDLVVEDPEAPVKWRKTARHLHLLLVTRSSWLSRPVVILNSRSQSPSPIFMVPSENM